MPLINKENYHSREVYLCFSRTKNERKFSCIVFYDIESRQRQWAIYERKKDFIDFYFETINIATHEKKNTGESQLPHSYESAAL